MSDGPSPFDDPFAEIFGKLPDPRARDARGDGVHAGEKKERSTPPAPPTSRRAAREAGRPATPPASSRAPAASRPSAVATAPTIDDLFSNSAPADHGRRASPATDRRRRRLGAGIVLGLILLLLGGTVTACLWVWNTYESQIRAVMGWEEPRDFEPGLAHGEALVTVVSGDTGRSISQTLFDAGVTKTPAVFYDHLIATGQNPTFQPGVFTLQYEMTAAAALESLLDPANRRENSALLREGLTVEQSLPILAEGVGLPMEDLEAAVADPAVYGVAADSLEGWLFPAMYTFDPDVTATDVIATMVRRTVQSLDAAGVPVEDRQRILIVASIIEREARFEDDFYMVSRVVENRMDPANPETFGYLQMDSTAQFGYGQLHDGSVSSTQEALDDDNPWNTYRHPGLPIGPIANPGDRAIDAAMNPADGPWLYFVTVNPDSGETVFTETYAEHNRYVVQWQEWCAENPGRC